MRTPAWIIRDILLFMVLLGLTGGCATDQGIISNAAQANTQIAPAIENDPQITQYFQAIGDRIVAAAKYADSQHIGPPSHFKADNSWMFQNDIHFHLVNSKTVNAFTTGGQHVYIYNAAFQMCNNEDELAAVMSHEFAHIYCRHVQQGQNRQYGELGLAGLGAVAGYAAGGKEKGAQYAAVGGGAAMAAAQFIGMGFTRGDEAQAEQFGFIFYSYAGWDPNHFADFFQAMIDAGYDTTPGFLSDHPMLKDRVAAAKKSAAAWEKKSDDQYRKPEIDNAQQFAQVKARAQQIAASTPDDASLKQAQGLLASFSSCVAPADNQPEQVAVRQRLEKVKAQQAKQ
jgi:predicted Zn-dependent protease